LAKEIQDVAGVKCLRDECGSIVVKPHIVRKEYVEHLLRIEYIRG